MQSKGPFTVTLAPGPLNARLRRAPRAPSERSQCGSTLWASRLVKQPLFSKRSASPGRIRPCFSGFTVSLRWFQTRRRPRERSSRAANQKSEISEDGVAVAGRCRVNLRRRSGLNRTGCTPLSTSGRNSCWMHRSLTGEKRIRRPRNTTFRGDVFSSTAWAIRPRSRGATRAVTWTPSIGVRPGTILSLMIRSDRFQRTWIVR